jgi:isopentenyl diphosphate isomerase/L-lactate dehydrogenase-like FMN-dependent dehydrogenase
MFGTAPWLGSQDYDHDPVYGPVNVMEFAPLAKKKLDPLAWDYLDGGGEDEFSLRANREAFQQLLLRPRMLVNVQKIDLSLELLGKKLAYPILLDPSGGKNCFFPNGEVVVSQGAAKQKALHITNGGIDELVESGKGPEAWWQVTTGGQLRTPQTIRSFVKRLEAQGCAAICFTVDMAHVSHRERDIRNKLQRSWCESGIPPRDANGKLPPAKDPWRVGIYPSRETPTPTWQDLANLVSATKLPVVVKGIMTSEDAAGCVKHGAAAVIVSNHGGRQLDHTGGTIEALPEVVKEVGGKIPVLVDGGLRRGTDVLKALALGAKAVCIARPYLYGLAAFGQPGVERVIELLRTELALNMGMCGVPNLAAIDRSLVRYRSERR